MSGKQYTGLLLIVILTSFVSCVMISKGLLGLAKIRASQIELVDSNGKTRATLDSTGSLRLMDVEGHDRLVLSGFAGAQMQCLNRDGGTIVELNAAGGKCALEFNYSDGQTAARIGVNRGTPERHRLEVFKNGTPVWTVPE